MGLRRDPVESQIRDTFERLMADIAHKAEVKRLRLDGVEETAAQNISKDRHDTVEMYTTTDNRELRDN